MSVGKSWLRNIGRIVRVSFILLIVFCLTVPTSAQPISDSVVANNVVLPIANPYIPQRVTAPADYPPDPHYDIPWSANFGALSDVVAAFNNARAQENTMLGTFVKPMVAPSESEWAQMSEGERMLWMVNDERTARGLAPLQALETNVNAVAQSYAEWLLANNAWGHEADGSTPWKRLHANSAIGACHDSLAIAENLYFQGTTNPDGIPLIIEQALYYFMYMDQRSEWGHRHAILWTPYTENSGADGREGYLGVGHARGSYTYPASGKTYPYTDMIVMNFFDPCATWVQKAPEPVPEPPTPEPMETPLPPPQTHSASGHVSIPAEQAIAYQPFEPNTWPPPADLWEVVDTNGIKDGDYRWIADECNPYEGKGSGMVIGGGRDGWMLECADHYPNNARSWLVYGPFSLEDAIGATISANVWIYTELDYDMLCMMVSVDKETFDGPCVSGNSNGWVEEQMDLAYVHRVGNVLGRKELYMGFAFLTDESNTRPFGGAYVDNITLRKRVMQTGDALYGVEIATEDGHTAISDQSGNFNLTGLTPGEHTLTPSKAGYEFHPASLTVNVTSGDVTQLSFIGTPSVLLSLQSHALHLPFICPE
jgi:uncharacterized protein YkwD